MKQFPILLMSAILANSAFGQTLIIEQTNIVSVCYEDTSISGEMLTQVSNEVVRMFVPTLPLIEITRSEGGIWQCHVFPGAQADGKIRINRTDRFGSIPLGFHPVSGQCRCSFVWAQCDVFPTYLLPRPVVALHLAV